MTKEEIKLSELGDIDKLIAAGDQCTYCGKKLHDVAEEDRLYAKAIKRYFPVCSEACENEVTKYVENDKKHKKNFYTMLTVCAFTTLIGVIINRPIVAFVGVVIGGLSFVLFPYPITSFETFVNNPIKTTTRLVVIIGTILTLAGMFFLYMATTDRTIFSFS